MRKRHFRKNYLLLVIVSTIAFSIGCLDHSNKEGEATDLGEEDGSSSIFQAGDEHTPEDIQELPVVLWLQDDKSTFVTTCTIFEGQLNQYQQGLLSAYRINSETLLGLCSFDREKNFPLINGELRIVISQLSKSDKNTWADQQFNTFYKHLSSFIPIPTEARNVGRLGVGSIVNNKASAINRAYCYLNSGEEGCKEIISSFEEIEIDNKILCSLIPVGDSCPQ